MTAWSAFHFFSYTSPIGTELAHQSPEILAVIHKDQVAKLVEADIIYALSAENDKL